MKKIFIIFIVCCSACISNDKITIDYGKVEEKFIIDGPRSRIIYEYWEKYLQITNGNDCKKHFIENADKWKQSPKTYAALQITFSMFCKVHNIE
ncbi:hypothetical protein [Candidatus Uabimicrobium amorphum]|uniref:Uncharacterized protein n=1 Tax=Uabimicrobium amorphum TaxID=2596890 RepID=A0A5S9IT96_UABAM|nr:hypothetical protein [Candidatus Uabimicrobium amorphum]BBM87689.1 hypothetical protein UABAM_06101 [Candidatus Uabimicrobium amorphum]